MEHIPHIANQGLGGPSSIGQSESPARPGSAGTIRPSGGPSLHPSGQARPDVSSPQTMAWWDIPRTILPAKDVLAHVASHAVEVEQLLERLGSGHGVEEAVRRAPVETLEYLAVSARVGPQARAVIQEALVSRRQIAGRMAFDTDENLRVHAGGEEPIASLARQVLGSRHRAAHEATVRSRLAAGVSPLLAPRGAAALAPELLEYGALNPGVLEELQGNLARPDVDLSSVRTEALQIMAMSRHCPDQARPLIARELDQRHALSADMTAWPRAQLAAAAAGPHQPQAHLAAGELERRVAVDVVNLQMEILQAHETVRNEGL